MKTARFYILKQALHSERYLFACRLVEKAWKQNLSIYIHTDSGQQAQLIDDRLWEFNPESFIPHEQLVPDEHGAEGPPGRADLSDKRVFSPVIIGMSDEQAARQHRQLLVNLAAKLPDSFCQFDRVVEIANRDDAVLNAVRRHYLELQSAQFEIKIHDFSK
ncbi:MAG: hypothetical protein CSA52_03715 [Gammaproteobacteria bacterium]|nr:MAG: hypothetical protein CSB48_06120 [Pseudomonadota bacterium]PIE38129.1 MAG: hypothetical protein CSA52_03715 [Gammaproteobacteria bacterium]